MDLPAIVANVFCKTGQGGGIDPTCGTKGGGGGLGSFKVGQPVTSKQLREAGYKHYRTTGNRGSEYKHADGSRVRTKDDEQGRPVQISSVLVGTKRAK